MHRLCLTTTTTTFLRNPHFVEESKDNEYNPRMFTANFKGSPFDKITTVPNCITQVLGYRATNWRLWARLEHLTLSAYSTSEEYNATIASTFGAYDNDHAVAIEQSSATECIKQSTFTSFRSALSGWLTSNTNGWITSDGKMGGPALKNGESVPLARNNCERTLTMSQSLPLQWNSDFRYLRRQVGFL